MFLRALFISAAVLSGSVANAKTLTFAFEGASSFNPGLPGVGGIAGSIVVDTDAATQFGTTGRFNDGISNIAMSVNGAVVQSGATDTSNTIQQVQLGTGDAATFQITGGFGASGMAGVAIESVKLEIRPTFDLYAMATEDLFGSLMDGDIFDQAAIGYISMVVTYENSSILDSTILRGSNFDSFSLTVADDDMSAVPLPAGLPLLLAGLGALGLAKRRQLG